MKKRCICASPNGLITNCMFCGVSDGQRDGIFIEFQPLEDFEDATEYLFVFQVSLVYFKSYFG